MKSVKIYFLLSLIGILLLMFIANTPKPREATIDSIKYFDKKIELTTKEFNETLVIFDDSILRLKEGDNILFTGKRSEYRSQKQIVVETIKKV